MDRGAVAERLPTLQRGIAIEDRREEDWAVFGIEGGHLWGVRRESEPVLRGPFGHGRPPALQYGDVERIDADFHEHIRAVIGGGERLGPLGEREQLGLLLQT